MVRQAQELGLTFHFLGLIARPQCVFHTLETGRALVNETSTSRCLPVCSRPVTRFPDLEILNPKRISEAQAGRASWYPYYAGFSETFADRLIRSARLKTTAIVSDPWNGSGTTTAAAAGAGR